MHFLINCEGYWLASFLLTVSITNTFLKTLRKFWKKVLFKKTSYASVSEINNKSVNETRTLSYKDFVIVKSDNPWVLSQSTI